MHLNEAVTMVIVEAQKNNPNPMTPLTKSMRDKSSESLMMILDNPVLNDMVECVSAEVLAQTILSVLKQGPPSELQRALRAPLAFMIEVGRQIGIKQAVIAE